MRRQRAKTRSGRADQALKGHWMGFSRTRNPLPSSAQYAWLNVHLFRQGLKREPCKPRPERSGGTLKPPSCGGQRPPP